MLLGPVRVAWVRVELGAGRPVCHLVGTAHGRPVERRIPLATATALMARGAPSLVRRRPAPRPVPSQAEG
jgi:hypothetical protein